MALYAFDGTWNEDKDTGVYGINTNVVEFARAYTDTKRVVQKEGDGVQDDFYVSGPGTRHGLLGKIIGGAFGAGGQERVAEAKKAMVERFRQGDEIVDVVGFSRGAALALDFTNAIEGMKLVNQQGGTVRPVVRFLGLWDVVAAFGIPLNLGPIKFQRVNLGYHLKLGTHVRYCFHAMAMDEQRQAFRVTRVENGHEVWFRGVHSDVGGGDHNSGLSNITLAWMLRKAQAVGLPVNTALAASLPVDPLAAIKPSRIAIGGFRKMEATDRIHYTVAARQSGKCRNAPDGCAVESVADELNLIPEVRGFAGG